MPAPIHVLHAVRRYGPVGGMERYVWEVTRELAALGHRVEVVCERCHAEPPAGVEVHELGEILQRPRWLALLRFGWRVARWLRAHPRPGAVLHSNERLAAHDVTTFHGPPFATIRERGWWRRLSLRVAMQFHLERRELAAARLIVPNSHGIRRQLAHYYPEYAAKLTEPIVPGVAPVAPRAWTVAPPAGGILGFVGKEWERKGLPLAVEIARRLRKERPELELWVAGPDAEEVRHLFADWQGGYRLLGWTNVAEHLRRIDVLLHPAIAEPFGMAITEAMAAQARVVVSEACGAAPEVKPGSGVVVAQDASLDYWVAAVRAQLLADRPPPVYARGWRQVAQEHETLYRRLRA